VKHKYDICWSMMFGSEASFEWTVRSALCNEWPKGMSVFVPPFEKGTLTSKACINIIDTALRNKCKWTVIVHSDVAWPPDATARLIAHNKDIVCGWSAGRTCPHIIHVGRNYKPKTKTWTMGGKGTGLEEVDAVGGGMWCFRTEIFKKIPRPWFNFEMSANGDLTTEDFWFCRKARKHGFKVYIDWSINNKHKIDWLVTGENGPEYNGWEVVQDKVEEKA
jgi:hypothetical protein